MEDRREIRISILQRSDHCFLVQKNPTHRTRKRSKPLFSLSNTLSRDTESAPSETEKWTRYRMVLAALHYVPKQKGTNAPSCRK